MMNTVQEIGLEWNWLTVEMTEDDSAIHMPLFRTQSHGPDNLYCLEGHCLIRYSL